VVQVIEEESESWGKVLLIGVDVQMTGRYFNIV
jgi:hypothetical protein